MNTIRLIEKMSNEFYEATINDLIRLAVETERLKCENICMKIALEGKNFDYIKACEDIADAIKSRGEE